MYRKAACGTKVEKHYLNLLMALEKDKAVIITGHQKAELQDLDHGSSPLEQMK